MQKRGRHQKVRAPIHALPDHILQRRATAGDEEAWLTLFHRYVLDQLVAGSEGPWSSLEICLGNELWVHFQKHNDVVKMFVEIGSTFSFEKIKTHREEIEAWYDRLQTLQGPWSAGGRDLLFLELHMRNLHGESYQCLADMLNVKIAEDLVSWKDQQSREEAFMAQFRGQLRATVDFSGCLYGGAAV